MYVVAVFVKEVLGKKKKEECPSQLLKY